MSPQKTGCVCEHVCGHNGLLEAWRVSQRVARCCAYMHLYMYGHIGVHFGCACAQGVPGQVAGPALASSAAQCSMLCNVRITCENNKNKLSARIPRHLLSRFWALAVTSIISASYAQLLSPLALVGLSERSRFFVMQHFSCGWCKS